jgi:hypothetical protein
MTQGSTTTNDYSVFVISIDDVEWTRHWLGGKRCDQLIISLAKRPDVHPQVRIRAVESKATSKGDPIEPNASVDPFSEGLGQVTATLDALWSILSPTGVDQLVEDLRFSSFVEHLASVVLSELYPFESTDIESLQVIQVVSRLSKRVIQPTQIQLDGAVVCTQYRTAISHKVVRLNGVTGEVRPWDVFLIRAGTSELDTLLGPTILRMIIEAETEVTQQEAASGEEAAVQEGFLEQLQDAETAVNQPDAAANGEPVGTSDQTAAPSAPSAPANRTAQAAQLAQDLYLACRQRGFPVEAPLTDNIVLGPALVTVSLALQSGADLQPIQKAVANLAREVGVATISVENDPHRPYHVRFLVARRDREFPQLPSQRAPLTEEASQSYLGVYLGQDIEGKDYLSYISTWPHMLIGGTTGSGKTTFIRSLLSQIASIDAALVKTIIIDGKGEVDYFGVLSDDHFVPRFPEVLLGHDRVVEVFEWLVNEEVPARRRIIRDLATAERGRPRQARELYIGSLAQGRADPFPPLVIVVDEFAELMMSSGPARQRFEQLVQQVAQAARSMLVHLILATQRPDASVVSGGIKGNLSTRTALRLPTHHDSMTILGGKGAESLLGSGDLIFQSSAQPPIRLQGYSD